MLRLIAEINKASLDGVLLTFASINFLHFAIFLFLFCVVLMIVVSLLTKAPSEEQLAGLTFETTSAGEKEKSRATWSKMDVTLSAILVAVVVVIVLYFRG